MKVKIARSLAVLASLVLTGPLVWMLSASSLGGGSLGGTIGNPPQSSTTDELIHFSPYTLQGGISDLTAPAFGGVTMTSLLVCPGTSGAASWACTGSQAANLTDAGSGTTYGNATALSALDSGSTAVRFNGSGRKVGTTTTGGPSSADFALHVVFAALDDGTTQRVWYKHNGVNNGVIIGITTAGALQAFLGGSAIASGNNFFSTTDKRIADVWLTCDRGAGAGSLRLYANGKSVATGTCSTGDPGPSQVLTIGSEEGALTESLAGDVAFAGIYSCTDCIASNTQTDAVVAREHARLVGWLPENALGDPTPTHTRADSTVTAWLPTWTSGVATLWPVTAGWMRSAKWLEGAGGETFVGALLEGASTNNILRSRAFDNASWTKVSGAITANAVADPDGTTTCDNFEATDAAGDVAHCIEQDADCTNTGKCTFSAIVKAGAVTRVYIQNVDISGEAYFNLSTCGQPAATDITAGTDFASATNLGNGYCWIHAQYTGTAATDTWRICGATSSGDESYDDGTNATADFTLCRAQEEAGPPSMPIDTAGSTQTRPIDSLTFASAGNYRDDGTGIQIDAIHATIRMDHGGAKKVIAEVGDGTAANMINLQIGTIGQIASEGTITPPGTTQWSVSEGWAAGATSSRGDGLDGEAHWSTLEVFPSRIKHRHDGWAGANDLTAAVSVVPTTIRIGARTDATLPFFGVIGQVRIANPIVARGTVGAAVGDSCCAVAVSPADANGYPYPNVYANGNGVTLLGTSAIYNLCTSGAGSAAIATQYTGSVQGLGYTSLLVEGGVNDLATLTAAQIYDNMDAIPAGHAAERGTGGKTICVEIAPAGASSGFTSTMEARRIAYNALLAADGNCTCHVNLDSALGQAGTCASGGGSCVVLQAAYDSGDGLHPDEEGSNAISAALVSICGAF